MSMIDAPKATALADRLDIDLNRRAGWRQDACTRNLRQLIDDGQVEVGWRESCGSTDPTLHAYRAWRRVVAAARKDGMVITETPVKHGNSWASRGGGFWQSIIFKI